MHGCVHVGEAWRRREVRGAGDCAGVWEGAAAVGLCREGGLRTAATDDSVESDKCMQGKPLVLPSVLGGQEWEIRAPFILEMAAIGLECFDCGFYLHANPDLSNLSCWQAFAHFANYGQFEMRMHR